MRYNNSLQSQLCNFIFLFPFNEQKNAITHSGMSRKSYTKAVRVIQALLDIRRVIPVRDVALRLGAPSLTDSASRLLKR